MSVVVSLQSKTCSQCGEVKLLDSFHLDKSKKDGYRSQCKICKHKSYSNKPRVRLVPSNVYRLDNTKSIYGCVYMFRDSANNALKVGFTTDLTNRTKQHKTSNPFLVLVNVILKVDMQTEKRLHDRLEPYRLTDTQEWYEDSLDVLDIFDSYDHEKALVNIRRLRELTD